MSAYCVFDVLKMTDTKKMEAYCSQIFDNVAQHGGRSVVIDSPNVVEGTWQPTFPVIIEFSTLEQAHQWYSSEDYVWLKSRRFEASEANAGCLEES
ncbi:MAG TPA: DUF1330 domain-containing protein [Trichocoleus sp.]|jgi:uncharacterized protein (DUF1330 family)